MRTRMTPLLLFGAASLSCLTACNPMAITSAPDVEYQDVSLSLATVNPEEYLHFFEYDRSQPLDVEVVRSWRQMNVTVTELTYASPRGERVPTLLFEPDGEGPFAGLVLMHGAPGQKENFKDLGVYYAQYGFVAIAIDAPQFRSDHNIGHVSMALIWPRFEERDLEEQSQLIVDLQRAVDLLLTLDTVDPERLTYIGGSYGGAMGGLFAGVETRLKAYVLKVGDGGIIEHLSEPDESGYPVTLKRWVDILWPIEPLHFVTRAAPAELLFQNGVTDSYVPASDSLRYQQAASEPKTILWYNAGHFLPARHYYDHLMWQHRLIGADTLLLKPFFSPSGVIYDRLLLLWFAVSALSLLLVGWLSRAKSGAGWGETLSWLLVVLFLGVVGLMAYVILRRRRARGELLTDAARALSASLWIVPISMIGIVAIQQLGFATVIDWRIIGLLLFAAPQLAACLALLFRQLANRPEGAAAPRWVTLVFSTLFVSTIVTLGAFALLGVVGQQLLHFSFPFYHPLAWVVIMVSTILLVFAAWPLHLLLGRWGMPVLEMPVSRLVQQAGESHAFPWYKPLGMWIGSCLILFLAQAFYVSTMAPNYVTFIDVVKTMLGLGSGV